MANTDISKLVTLSLLAIFLLSIPTAAFFPDFGGGGFIDTGDGGFVDDGDGGFFDDGDGGFIDNGDGGFIGGGIDSGSGVGGDIDFVPVPNGFDDDFTPFDPLPGIPVPEPVPPFVPEEPQPVPPTVTPRTPSAGPGPAIDTDLDLRIESTRFPFETYPGELVPFYITIKNDGDEHLPNTKIVIVQQELGLRYSAGPFDLNRGDKEQRVFSFEVPEGIEDGIYPLRFTVTSNSVTKRIVYRDLDVLPLE